MEKHITTPITQKITKDLKSGDYVYITGEMYVARDAAHKRMTEELAQGKELPFDVKDQIIYYLANRYKGFDNLLYGTITGQRWSSNWLSRTYNSNKNGQICPKTA